MATDAARLMAAGSPSVRIRRDGMAMRWQHVLVLALVLPIFGQSFHYVKSVPALWALSKAFPIMSLPLCLALFGGARPIGSRQVMITFVWLTLVPTFLSLWSFQQTFFVALTSQVKLLPILYFFSFLGLLRWLRPTGKEIGAAFLIAAAVTFALLLVVWRLAPQSAYTLHYNVGDAPLLGADARGNRIRMPMFFGIIGIFYAYRRFLSGYRPPWLVAAVAGFALIFWLVRMRSIILGVAVVAAINAFLTAGMRVRLMLVALIPFAGLALFSVPLVASIFSTDRSFAFDVRWISTVKAIDFLGTNPLRWIFGVGSISPVDPAGMMTYFNHFFFLADITWMGILFEFGLIGACLIMALPVRGILIFQQVRRVRDDPFVAALQDYLLYAIIISEMFPMTLAPGELTVIMAIGVYRLEQLRAEGPRIGVPA